MKKERALEAAPVWDNGPGTMSQDGFRVVGMRETYGNSGGNSEAILGNSGAFSAIRVRRGPQNVGVAAIRSPGSEPL